MGERVLIWLGTIVVVWMAIGVLYVCYSFWWKPKVSEMKLKKQGIRGPSPSFIMGNILEMKRMMAQNSATPKIDGPLTMFPYFNHWTRKFGNLFRFRLGGIQMLYVSDPEIVKEIELFRSLDMGKPAYLQNERGVLLGKGLITTSGTIWSYQRKTLCPPLYKTKGMVDLFNESGCKIVASWKKMIEANNGAVDIKVDDYMRSFTSYATSKMVFGKDHSKGITVFPMCRDLIKAMGSATTLGLPFSRFVPNKSNGETQQLAKEIQGVIMEIATERSTTLELHNDVLQIILEAAQTDDIGSLTQDEFIVDNCKNVILAAYEVTAIAAVWGLMLLASNPEWQDRARSNVMEVCGGQLPDYSMLGDMKVLNMVIQEVLRLYPGVALTSRQAMKDVKLGNMEVPKDVNIWIFTMALHRDPQQWGSDADTFNPQRFINGVHGACKSPKAYIPFGIGARVCPGQNMAFLSLKLVFALIRSNFKLTLSPSYVHSPKFGLLLEPEHGVNLIVNKI